jgi:8-oxo-dGTP pyrophosphatase MutT (NUDIX family)
VTVAAVVEREGRFLLVEEWVEHELKINQPAGHLEAGESLGSAVARESLEETGYSFVPSALLGIYRWVSPTGVAYLRFAFCGSISDHDPARPLDAGIVHAGWFALEELRAATARHRSPMVMWAINDYLAGKTYPLDLLRDLY